MPERRLIRTTPRFGYLAWVIPGLLYVAIISYISSTQYQIGGRGIETDFYWDYAPAADDILDGKFPIDHLHFRGPGYPLALASFGWLGDTFLAGKTVSILSAGLVVMLFGYLLTKRFGYLFGLIGVCGLIANGVFLEYSIRVGSDMFFLMLNLLVVTLLTLKKSLKVALSVGFIAALAYLTRYNGVAMIALVCCWIVVILVQKVPGYKHYSLAAISSMMILVFSWLFLYFEHSDPNQPISNLSNVFYEIEATADVNWDKYWYGNANKSTESPRQISVPNLIIAIKYALGNIYHNFRDDMELVNGDTLTVMALAGIVVLVFGQISVGVWGWGLVAGIFNYIILLFIFHSPRFSLCLLPMYIVCALFFFDWMRSKLINFSQFTEYGIVFIILILFFNDPPPQTWRKTLNRFDQSQNYLIQFSDQIKANHLESGRLAARKPHLAYLLDLPFSALPILRNTDELLDWMKANNISYLFLDLHGAYVRPGIAGLLGKDKHINGLQLVSSHNKSPKAAFWRLQNTKN